MLTGQGIIQALFVTYYTTIFIFIKIIPTRHYYAQSCIQHLVYEITFCTVCPIFITRSSQASKYADRARIMVHFVGDVS